MPKKTSFHKEVARKVVAPIILKLLKPYTARDLAEAIRNDVDLAEALKANDAMLGTLMRIVGTFPFTGNPVYSDKIARRMKDRRWIKWFVNDVLRRKRPDLYAQIVYTPGGFDYIVKQVRNIVKLLFG